MPRDAILSRAQIRYLLSPFSVRCERRPAVQAEPSRVEKLVVILRRDEGIANGRRAVFVQSVRLGRVRVVFDFPAIGGESPFFLSSPTTDARSPLLPFLLILLSSSSFFFLFSSDESRPLACLLPRDDAPTTAAAPAPVCGQAAAVVCAGAVDRQGPHGPPGQDAPTARGSRCLSRARAAGGGRQGRGHQRRAGRECRRRADVCGADKEGPAEGAEDKGKGGKEKEGLGEL